MSDADLIEFTNAMNNIRTTQVQDARIVGPNLISKLSPQVEDEVAAMRLAQKIGIRVPTVRRTIPGNEAELQPPTLIMDRAHGKTLEELWPEIGWWRTVRLAWQMRSFIRLMQRVHSTTSGGLVTGYFHSQWFEGCYGPKPHATPQVFTSFLNWWLIPRLPDGKEYPKRSAIRRPPLDPPKMHTFVHQDLVPRNMIVDEKGLLWLVDWGNAGFYPKELESISMHDPKLMPFSVWPPGSWKRTRASWRWWLFCLVATGSSMLRTGTYLKYWTYIRGNSLGASSARGPFSSDQTVPLY